MSGVSEPHACKATTVTETGSLVGSIELIQLSMDVTSVDGVISTVLYVKEPNSCDVLYCLLSAPFA
jgi:hypothetical protein